MIAYLATLAAWGVISWRVTTFRVLMKDIEKLPEEDRFAAIEAVLGRIKVRRGLSAEQYLRARIQTFVLIGFLAACATIVLVSGTALIEFMSRKTVQTVISEKS